jgi:hypothetical protein
MAQMSAADLEKLARYEEAIRELEARQGELEKNRAGYMKMFAALVVVSFAGFFWNVWLGAATFFTGVLMGVFGVYVVRVRAGDYALELEHLRETMEELRAPDVMKPTPAPSRPSGE